MSSTSTGLTHPSQSSSGNTTTTGTYRHEVHGILKTVAPLNLELLDVGVDLNATEWLTDPNWEFDATSWEDVTLAQNIARDGEEEADKENINEKDLKHLCRICDKVYKRKNDARIHVGEAHLALYKFFCPYCPHKTSRGWSYDRHMRNVHKVNADRPKRGSFRNLPGVAKRHRPSAHFAP